MAALTAVLLAAVSTSVHASEPEPEPPMVVAASAPESGTGLITLGSLLIVGGVAAVAGSSYAVSEGQGSAYGIVGGTVLAGAGSVFIWLGTRRVRKLRAWSEATQMRVPPSGAGLLISGLTVAVGGAISLTAVGVMSIAHCEGGCFPRNTDVWYGVGGSAIVLGLGTAVTGGVLQRRHKQWRAGGSTTRLQIVPTFAPMYGGVQLGVVGRF